MLCFRPKLAVMYFVFVLRCGKVDPETAELEAMEAETEALLGGFSSVPHSKRSKQSGTEWDRV